MANQRFGEDSFDDDESTRFFGAADSSEKSNDDAATEFIGGAGRPGDDEATQFFGGPQDGDQETQFFGDNSAWGNTGTSGASQPQASSEGGQYWAPLSGDEQGYSDADFAPTGSNAPAAGAAGGGYPPQQPPFQQQPELSNNGGAAGVVKGLSAKGIIGIVAAVIIIGLLIWFFVGSGNDSPEPAAPVETTTEAPPPEESVEPTDGPSPLEGEMDRLRQELDNLREDPPSIPGLPGAEVTEQVIPEAAGKSPAEVELNLRRLGFSNVSVVDSNGAPVSYSLASVTGSVAQIDPPSGSGVATDTPVTITLR